MPFNFRPLFVRICLGVIGFLILVQVAMVAFAPISFEPPATTTTSPQQPKQPTTPASTGSGGPTVSELVQSFIGVALVAGVLFYMWRPTHKEWVLYEV